MRTIVARSPGFNFRVVRIADQYAIEHFNEDRYYAGPDPQPSQWAPSEPWGVVERNLETEEAAVDRMAVWESRL